MKDLIDLVQVVKSADVEELQLFKSENKSKRSKLSDFYALIARGELKNDDAAAQHFYQQDRGFPAYQKLRKTVKDLLINAIFLIDLKKPSYTERQKAYYECYREWAAAKILFGKEASYSAISISQKLIRVCKKYEFTELLVDITHSLRLYYGTIIGDLKKYKHYNKLFKQYEALWIVENKAEEYYTQLSIGFVNSKANKANIEEKAVDFYEDLKSALDTFESYQLHLCARLIQVSIYNLRGDKEGAIKVCNEAIAFFETKKYIPRVPLQVFYYEKLVSHFQLRDFGLCLELVSTCEKYLDTASFNWFKLKELQVLIHLHLDQWQEAKMQMLVATQQEGFTSLPESIVEFWTLLSTYLQFFEGITNSSEAKRSFRKARFLNEVETLSKDKAGMNIPILVLQILMDLYLDNKDAIIDSMDAINQYRKRHLQSAEHQRGNLFIKMLLTIPRKGFEKEKVKRAAQASYDQLLETPFELAVQAYQMELVPYEKLWQIVLNKLL